MRTHYFISGLPRSGSTLLSSILQQNPEFYADISSPLQMIVENTVRVFTECENSPNIDEERRIQVIQSIFDGYYGFINSSVIFDTCRTWTRNSTLLKTIFPNTKIICCVRDIPEIINSFEKVWNNSPLYYKQVNEFTYSNNIFERSDEIYNRSIIPNYISLKEGYTQNPDMIYFVNYEDLCKFPSKIIKEIYDFIEQPHYTHDFNNLKYDNHNFDLKCGIPHLHKIQEQVKWNECKYLIPEEIIQKYKSMRMEFWKPSNQSQGLIALPNYS